MPQIANATCSQRSLGAVSRDRRRHYRGSRRKLHLKVGETLCLLGEFGSGKDGDDWALMRLLPPTAQVAGCIALDGIDVLTLNRAELAAIRGAKVSMIFQDPMVALDPVFTVGQQISEKLRAHERLTRRQAGLARLSCLILFTSRTLAIASTPTPTSSRAVFANASWWRWPSPADRSYCWRTSQQLRSMRPYRSKSCSCCASSSARWVWRSSS